ncbi:acyltransferase [Sphingosinicella sp. BN140058]|uniref:acyltransferase family protein n=1 Tax=Sphingosinicella sp. BN140058 TaxID=1892855 RepID=UPI001010CBE1|nr:acyltransferase [Sphingosinicella sp. BN140058]QAY77483.1 acyltransferase [Sphingosinicella sp. BN140058]
MSAPQSANPAEGQATRSTLFSLQAMRGIAAFAVAVYHTNLILKEPVYGGIHAFDTVASRGWTGVNFFFVLSGFIILYAHAKDIGMPARAGRYLWRRFSRVYPVYWLVLTGFIAASSMGLGHAEFTTAPLHLLSSYTLLRIVPAPDLPLQVAWTLVYEVTFYLAFLVVILNRRIGFTLIALWTTAVLINGLILGDSQTGWTHVWNLYFLIGALSFAAFQRIHGAKAGGLLFAAGFALLAILFGAGLVDPRLGFGQGKPLLLIALAVGFALILLGSVVFERARPLRVPATLVLLGEASYAIYLVHSPVISLLAGLNRRLLYGAIPAEILFFLILAASVLAGLVAHFILEKPLLRLMRGFERSRAGNGTAQGEVRRAEAR